MIWWKSVHKSSNNTLIKQLKRKRMLYYFNILRRYKAHFERKSVIQTHFKCVKISRKLTKFSLRKTKFCKLVVRIKSKLIK